MGTRSLPPLNNTSKTLAAGSTTEIHIEPMIPIRPANSRSNASTDLVSYYRDVRMMQENARRTQQRHSHSMNPSSSGGTVKYPRTHSIPFDPWATIGGSDPPCTAQTHSKPSSRHSTQIQRQSLAPSIDDVDPRTCMAGTHHPPTVRTQPEPIHSSSKPESLANTRTRLTVEARPCIARSNPRTTAQTLPEPMYTSSSADTTTSPGSRIHFDPWACLGGNNR